jgi:hypothetical protein
LGWFDVVVDEEHPKFSWIGSNSASAGDWYESLVQVIVWSPVEFHVSPALGDVIVNATHQKLQKRGYRLPQGATTTMQLQRKISWWRRNKMSMNDVKMEG